MARIFDEFKAEPVKHKHWFFCSSFAEERQTVLPIAILKVLMDEMIAFYGEHCRFLATFELKIKKIVEMGENW